MAADESADASPGLALPALGDDTSPAALRAREHDSEYQSHLRKLRHTLVEALPAADWKKIIRSVVEIGTNGDGKDKKYTAKDITGAASFLRTLMTEESEPDEGGSVPAQSINEFTRAARLAQAQDDFISVIEGVVDGKTARALSVHGLSPRQVDADKVAPDAG